MPNLDAEVAGGNFVLQDGTIVGKHEGYPFYTIGQRKGLGIAMGYPIFVTEIRKDTNEVVLGKDPELYKDSLVAGQINLGKYASLDGLSIETITKIRYKDAGSPALIRGEGDKIVVDFHEPVSAIAPGQAAVFYEGDDVVGGGWILKSYNKNFVELHSH
jgi:tRNA-specific 2-thiouridylase